MKLPNFRRSRVVPILAATVLVAGVPAGSANPAGLDGLIPTGWYPVALERDAALGQMVVTNAKGVGALGPAQSITRAPGPIRQRDATSTPTWAPCRSSRLR